MLQINAIHHSLQQCRLFTGIPESAYTEVLHTLRAKRHAYPKNEAILNIGDHSHRAGIIISGTMEISFYDESGNCVNMRHISAGEIFGAALVCAGVKGSPMQLRAISDCELLFLDFEALMEPAAAVSPHCMQIALNLMQDFARRSLFLNQKIRIMGQKKLRDKLKIYFASFPGSESGSIHLPFSRTELAEYLYADRSALSRELSRMREEGLIDWTGREIHILDKNFLQS